MVSKKSIPTAGYIFGGVILLSVILLAIFFLKKDGKNDTKVVTTFPSVTPRPFPTGPQTYRVSRSGASAGPNISRVIVDNMGAKIGAEQTFSIKITGDSPVTSVILTVTTDNKEKTYEAKLKEGKPTDGTWEAVIQSEDTRNSIFLAKIEANDGKDKFAITLTFR